MIAGRLEMVFGLGVLEEEPSDGLRRGSEGSKSLTRK
jgi:hypothetical protein